jgi:hypothetical protein
MVANGKDSSSMGKLFCLAVWLVRCNLQSATCNIAALQRCNIAALQHCNIAALQHAMLCPCVQAPHIPDYADIGAPLRR